MSEMKPECRSGASLSTENTEPPQNIRKHNIVRFVGTEMYVKSVLRISLAYKLSRVHIAVKGKHTSWS